MPQTKTAAKTTPKPPGKPLVLRPHENQRVIIGRDKDDRGWTRFEGSTTYTCACCGAKLKSGVEARDKQGGKYCDKPSCVKMEP